MRLDLVYSRLSGVEDRRDLSVVAIRRGQGANPIDLVLNRRDDDATHEPGELGWRGMPTERSVRVQIYTRRTDRVRSEDELAFGGGRFAVRLRDGRITRKDSYWKIVE
jgi:hypothetical protein